MRRITWAPVIAIAGALFVSAGLAAHDPITTKVTWTHDIARLFEARCVSCHKPGGRGPMPLTSYEEARPWARAIREEVLARRMPKWHAARGYGQFANDPSLTPFEIALVTAWVDGGAPKGTPSPPAKKAPPRNPASPPASSSPDKPALFGKTRVTIPIRNETMGCGSYPATGVLTALTPELEPGGSVGIVAVFADGRREILAWIRDYDPKFPTTYQLRQGMTLSTGTRLIAEGPSDCRIKLTFLGGPLARGATR